MKDIGEGETKMAECNNISKLDRNACSNCGACYNICPSEAIEQQYDIKGMSMQLPKVNSEKCTNCGLCLKVCPIIHNESNNLSEPDCYAAMASDEIREKSSSGGIFTILAEYVLDKGGYIAGVAYRNDWSTHHIIIDKKEDLDLLRGSKYIISDMENTYQKIKELLKQDKWVLFSGSPCHVAGLNNYLNVVGGGENYEKLLTVDLVCHGAPDYRVFKKYLDEKFDVNEIKQIKFRDKLRGWCSTSQAIYKKDGTTIVVNRREDPYQLGFHPGLLNRKSCSPCRFSKLPRPADFTIGDYWYIDKIRTKMNDKKGTSFFAVNSEKARKVFSEIKCELKLCESTPLKEIKAANINRVFYKPINFHPNRDKFYKNLYEDSFKNNVDKYINNKYDVCLLSIFYGQNYGSMLVSYAVNHIIEELGYSVLMLQKLKNQWGNYSLEKAISMNFAKKHYNMSNVYEDETDLIKLNDICENFVVGSDQIFRPPLQMDFAFLNWVKLYKNKIAFSTSFGVDTYNATEENILYTQHLFDRFNHFSLREKSDNLCNNIFKLNPPEFIDPSLMVKKEVYEKLAAEADIEIQEPYLLTYILDFNEDKLKVIKYVAEKLNLKIVNIYNMHNKIQLNEDYEFIKNWSVEEFLKLYKNANYVITDSYHGTCFSVKFNKPFISIINNPRGGLRYNLFYKLNLKDRFINNYQEVIDNEEILKETDYAPINKYIEEESKTAVNWLDEALKNNNSKTKFSSEQIALDLKEKKQNIINKTAIKEKNELKNKQNELNNKQNELNNKQNKLGNKQIELADKIDLLEKIIVQMNEKNKITLLEKIFSVRNERRLNIKHKVVRILGIKMKFLCK